MRKYDPKTSSGSRHASRAALAEAVAVSFNQPRPVAPAILTSHGEIRIIRAAAVMHRVTCITTLAAALAAIEAIRALRQGELTVKPLQDWFA